MIREDQANANEARGERRDPRSEVSASRCELRKRELRAEEAKSGSAIQKRTRVQNACAERARVRGVNRV